MNRPHPSSILDPQSSSSGRRAFTLIELLVVLGLLVLALAAAVPAFNAMTGSRSTDAGENIVAATLQRARTTAIQTGVPTGVLFFLNPADQRATMVLISQAAGEDIYSNYRGWSETSYQQQIGAGLSSTPQNTVYDLGHDTIALSLIDARHPSTTANPVPPLPLDQERYRHVVKSFTHDNSNLQTAPPANAPWATADVTYDLLPDTGFETLPANVAVQTINDQKGENRDRYLQTGVILFDGTGRCISAPYKFKRDSDAYNLIKAAGANTNFIPESTNALTTLYSQIGVVLYDRTAFRAQANFTEGDPVYKTGGTFGGTDLLSAPGPNAGGQETAEEQWLDKETTPLLVNRGNGAILRAQ